jgi:stringent starvation protein B
MSEISTKPYLIRAIHQWCSDQGLTPYLSVVVDHRTLVPRQFVQDGQIVLNVSTDATQSLVMGNEMIAFQARFGGVAQNISFPSITCRRSTPARTVTGWPSKSAPAASRKKLTQALISSRLVRRPRLPADAEPKPPKGGGRSHLKLVK